MMPNPVTEAMLFERRHAEDLKWSANYRLGLLVWAQRKSAVRAALLRLAHGLIDLGRYLARHLEDQSGDHGQAALTTERMIHSH